MAKDTCLLYSQKATAVHKPYDIMKKQVPAVSVLCIWRKKKKKDFTLVLLSGETWFKLSFLMLSHGMPSHVHIGVCCSVSATRTFGLIYFLIPWIHADITHKTFLFEHLFDCDRTCAYCRQQSIFLALSCLSVRPPTWIHSAPTGRIFKKFHIRGFLQNPSRKFKFH